MHALYSAESISGGNARVDGKLTEPDSSTLNRTLLHLGGSYLARDVYRNFLIPFTKLVTNVQYEFKRVK